MQIDLITVKFYWTNAQNKDQIKMSHDQFMTQHQVSLFYKFMHFLKTEFTLLIYVSVFLKRILNKTMH